MRKKLVKKLEASLPHIYNREGRAISRKDIANKILDNISYPERLELQPFEVWVPFVCSTCAYNGGRNLGCTYDLIDKKEEEPPEDCPLGY